MYRKLLHFHSFTIFLFFSINLVSLSIGGLISTDAHATPSKPPEPEPDPDPQPEPDPDPQPNPEPDPNPSGKPHVSGFSLYDENTDHDISMYSQLKDGDTINLNKLDSVEGLNIRAIVNGQTQSVNFVFDNLAQRVENAPPYTVFEENGSGAIHLNKTGSYTIWALPFSEKNGQGQMGATASIKINIIEKENTIPEPEPDRPSILAFTLFDDRLEQDIQLYSDIRDGDVVDLSRLSDISSLNIKAKVNGLAQSVRFSFNNKNERVENSAPFTVFQSNSNGPSELNKDQSVTVWAQAFSEKSATGDRGEPAQIRFTIKKKAVTNPDPGTDPDPDPPNSDYDPRKDPAYNGYKYRPGQGYTTKKYKLPPKPSCVREVKSTITVNGTFDGNGCLYIFKGSWNGKSYKDLCYAPKEISENTPPMFDLKPGAKLRNVVIECALDGIHTSRDNVIENVIMRDVEEDAITVKQNVVIKNSEFWFCNDKCIQMNSASGVDIVNNKFYYSSFSVLANWGEDVTVKNNYFYEANTAIRSRSNKSDVSVQNNTHDGGTCHLMPQEKGVIYDYGGDKVTNVRNRNCVQSGGKIIRK